MIHLDTHVLLWILLWITAGLPDKGPPGVLARIETEDVACS